MYRALNEFRVRGVKTNIEFVKNVLSHPDFYNGTVDTSFIDANPSLFDFDEGSESRIQRLLEFLGEMAVNGNTPLDQGGKPFEYLGGVKPPMPALPAIDESTPAPDGWRKIL